MFKIPFVIYYDTEVIIQDNKHIPISICAFRKCISNPTYTKKPIVFTGKDCIDQFLCHLRSEEQEILSLLDTVEEPLRTDAKDNNKYKHCTHCEVCGVLFNKYERKF